MFPYVFGDEFTPEEFVTWQAYDLLVVCTRYDMDPRDYDEVEELIDDIARSRAKETIKIKKLSEGSRGN